MPWGWRLSLGLAAIPASMLTVGGLLLPDSPASLEERGRPAQARRVLERVRGTTDVDAGAGVGSGQRQQRMGRGVVGGFVRVFWSLAAGWCECTAAKQVECLRECPKRKYPISPAPRVAPAEYADIQQAAAQSRQYTQLESWRNLLQRRHR